jgi:hypothetical protein
MGRVKGHLCSFFPAHPVARKDPDQMHPQDAAPGPVYSSKRYRASVYRRTTTLCTLITFSHFPECLFLFFCEGL